MKALIFDLFNTLTEGKCRPEEKIIYEFSLPFSYFDKMEEIICAKKFVNMPKYLNEIVKNIGLGNSKKTRDKLMKIIKEEAKRPQLLPEAKPILKKLKEKGYKLALISNAPIPDYNLIKKEKIEKLFNAVLFSYQLGIAKPSPEIFRLCLRTLKASPSQALMIGDSLAADIEGAYAVGIKGVLVSQKGCLSHIPYATARNLKEAEGPIDLFFKTEKTTPLQRTARVIFS